MKVKQTGWQRGGISGHHFWGDSATKMPGCHLAMLNTPRTAFDNSHRETMGLKREPTKPVPNCWMPNKTTRIAMAIPSIVPLHKSFSGIKSQSKPDSKEEVSWQLKHCIQQTVGLY